MSFMFAGSQFNGDISEWDVRKVTTMKCMFSGSPFKGNVSNWQISNDCVIFSAFNHPHLSPLGIACVLEHDVLLDSCPWGAQIAAFEPITKSLGLSRLEEAKAIYDIIVANPVLPSEAPTFFIFMMQPTTRDELRNLIDEYIAKEGTDCDLNHIDISLVTDMSELFSESYFNGDISQWNVAHVNNMHAMFENSPFQGDISRWDVSNVTDMSHMFSGSTFLGDISTWNVSKVQTMAHMWMMSKFQGDLSRWDTSAVQDMHHMFFSSVFHGDISRWDVSNVTDMSYMFSRSLFNQDISKWNTKSVTTMESMFSDSYFSQDISRWNVSNVQNMSSMFSGSSFSSDISSWRVHPEAQTYGMFFNIEKESLKGLNLPNTSSFILKLLNYEYAKQWVDGHKESIYHWQFYLAAFDHDVEALNDDVKDHLDQYRALLQGLDLGLLKSADFLHQAWQQRVNPCVEQSIEPFNFMP